MRCHRPTLLLAALLLLGCLCDSPAKAADNAKVGNNAKPQTQTNPNMANQAQAAAKAAKHRAHKAANKDKAQAAATAAKESQAASAANINKAQVKSGGANGRQATASTAKNSNGNKDQGAIINKATGSRDEKVDTGRVGGSVITEESKPANSADGSVINLQAGDQESNSNGGSGKTETIHDDGETIQLPNAETQKPPALVVDEEQNDTGKEDAPSLRGGRTANGILQGALRRAAQAVEAASAATGLDAKLKEIGENHLVDSAVKAVKETITATKKGVTFIAESNVGKMAGDMAMRASESAGDAATKMMTTVGESTKDVAESLRAKIDEKLGGIDAAPPLTSSSYNEKRYFPALLAAVALVSVLAFAFNKLRRCRRRRAVYFRKKIKIDERVEDSIERAEEGSFVNAFCTKDVPDASARELKQPFQLYHEFEYKMRKRYQNSSSSQQSITPGCEYDTIPGLSSTSRGLSFGSVDDSYGDTGKEKVWFPKEHSARSSLRRQVLVGTCGVMIMGIIVGTMMMPKDMSFGDLYLMTAEYVYRLIMGGYVSSYVL